MSCANLDLELQSVLESGFEHIRKHPEIIDEIFANLKNPHHIQKYGQAEINKIRQWILENDIPVILGWNLNPQRIPAISLHLAEASEQVENAFMSDHGGIDSTTKASRVIVPEFVPISFDATSGTIVAPTGTDLSLVNAGHILVDAKGEEYLIELVDAVNYAVTVLLEGAPLDASKVKITSFIKTELKKRGETYMMESIDIGVHGHADAYTVIWMYNIVLWILLRFKQTLEQRCISLGTFSASDFNRMNQYLGENCFSRFIRFTARTRFFWEDDAYDQIDTVKVNVEFDK